MAENFSYNSGDIAIAGSGNSYGYLARKECGQHCEDTSG